MQSSGIFKKIDKEIKFKSEKELEDFIVINLEPLLGMKFIAKQYRVNGEVCDILAIDAEIDKQEDWNEDIIDYYMRLNYAGKLGIPLLTSEEYIGYTKRFRSQCKREFVVKFYDDNKENARLATLKFKLPLKVLPWQFSMWAWSNMNNIDSAGDSEKLYKQCVEEDNYILRRVYYK
jgi:hypothetical protein